jgi:hypothetical protein
MWDVHCLKIDQIFQGTNKFTCAYLEPGPCVIFTLRTPVNHRFNSCPFFIHASIFAARSIQGLVDILSHLDDGRSCDLKPTYPVDARNAAGALGVFLPVRILESVYLRHVHDVLVHVGCGYAHVAQERCQHLC